MHMKIEDENEKKKLLKYQNTGAFSIAGSGIFDTNVTLSPHTLKLAGELGSISLNTRDGQTDYLLKTPKFANSVFTDTSITALKLHDQFSYPHTSNLDHFPYFTSDSGTVRLGTSGILGTQYTTGALALDTTGTLKLAGSYDISPIISTGLAVESVTGLFSPRVSDYDSSVFTIPTGKVSSGLPVSTQSIYTTPAFRESFQTIKTDFIVGHRSDIEQRFVMALENSVIQAKRSNDLKEKELSIKEQEVKSQEKTNKTLVKILEEQQKILRLAFPSPQLEESKVVTEQFHFNSQNGTLKNSYGKVTAKISGQPLRLLQCFLSSKTYSCKKATVMKAMGNNLNIHSGASNKLKTLLHGVAKIESIKNKDSNREVDSYRLIGIKN